ncbi:type I polyketide synthase [Gynuella sunshinyii]|uniref:Polyketide synthase modules-related protein n=1 Tax=Gynuella sunshinyii YC6258 TaxID=1445510 RepID=A0A0C5VPW1_9GAMM|nr:type I polyketide synthase [Gynuella sunshinyii]AJQ96657.1 polyketide synthase modules-related protein [Gynuella sunshinyii YC6258]
MKKDIAVIGIGSFFPDAPDTRHFWSNILNKKDSIIDIPELYWELEDFYDSDPSARDKTYGKKAGVVDAVEFDSLEFGIPPKLMESISVDQLFALLVARQALMDANLLGSQSKPFNREKAGVILGAAIGKTAFSLSHRLQAPRLRKIILNSGVPEAVANHIIERIQDSELDWSEASNPGYLANIVAGRIANRFDFGGTNSTVDAACASSLSAIKYAVQELITGECDIVLTGGVNLDCSDFSFVSFSKTPAISKSNHCRPFDADSDGMLLGDGIGMMVLKRLDDAERDNDRVYAVLKGIGSSSDGKVMSIYAPNTQGQLKALHRAYENAQVEPCSVGLIEAHGTGTPAGDKCEVETLTQFFSTHETPARQIALGSVKSQIGHARLAAGAAGMIKAILALHHKILPPMINVTQPADKLAQDNSPFYVISESRPWIVNQRTPARRAGVSAFGFGGTNFHIVLEEYQKDHEAPYRLTELPREILLSADTKTDLMTLIRTGLEPDADDTSFAHWLDTLSTAPVSHESPRLGFVAEHLQQAKELLTQALKHLEQRTTSEWETPDGIYFREASYPHRDKIVALFPGQGSQYPHMLKSLVENYPELRSFLELADNLNLSHQRPALSDILYPISMYDPSREQAWLSSIHQTENTQPALGALSAGLFSICRKRGLNPAFFVGHSFGELTALWAAGAMTDRDFLEIAGKRGELMQQAGGQNNPGAMLAVIADKSSIEEIVASIPDLHIANMNSPQQTVLSGSIAAIEQAEQQLKAFATSRLPVSAAFHSPAMKPAQTEMEHFLADKAFHPLTAQVFANANGQCYPQKTREIKDRFVSQITSPVEFIRTIENVYQAGGRLFVEIGPKRVLATLVEKILGDREFQTISLNPSPKISAELQLRQALIKLKVLGVALSDDPYAIKTTPAPAKKQSPAIFTVDPTVFFTKETRARITEAVEKKDDLVLVTAANTPPEKVREHNHVHPEPNHVVNIKEVSVDKPLTTSDLTVIDNIQQLNGKVLQQFLKNQGEQIDILKILANKTADPILDRQLGLMESFQQNSFQAYSAFFNEQSRLMGTSDSRPTLQNATTRPSSLSHHTADNILKPDISTAPINHSPAEQSVSSSVANRSTSTTTFKTAEPVSNVTPVSVSTTIPSVPDNNVLSRILFSIISDKTGYPEDMLEADMNLESDLGIDSIKRVEIFSALNEALEGGIHKEDVEALASLSTILDITGYLANRSSAQAERHAPSAPQSTNASVSPHSAGQMNYRKILFTIISDKTGYPEDMLETDMNLESDLGIDSIKRVEIFSALNDAMASGIHKEDVEALANLTTIEEIIAYLTQTSDTQSSVTTPAPASVNPIATPPLPSDSGHLKTLFMQIISDKTGYPGDMLSVDMDLESDLGIDSIKRVEIFSALNEQLPSGLSREDVEALSGISNIDGIISYLATGTSTDSEQPIPQERFIKRYEVVPSECPLAGTGVSRIKPGSTIILFSEGSELTEILAQELLLLGSQPIIIAWQEQTFDFQNINESCAVIELTGSNETHFEEAFKIVSGLTHEIHGMLYLMPVHNPENRWESVWDRQIAAMVRGAFFAAKYFYHTALANLTPEEHDSRFFMALTRIDGKLGAGDQFNGRFTQGGLFGLMKSIKQEWERVFCHAVDIDPDCSAIDVADIVFKELAAIESNTHETGWKNGQRITLRLNEHYRHQPGTLSPTEKDFFFVPGGGRGITAECVKGMARTFKCRFLLMGRTKLSTTLPAWALDSSDKTTMRQKLMAAYKERGEPVKPAELDALITDVLNQQEIKDTLQFIKDAGGDAMYFSGDITDETEVKSILAKAQTGWGPVTGFIHGAGVLADKKIQRKTEADYEGVFNTKVVGLQTVLQALDPAKLRFLMFFSSIAGFFGSGGQCDYSMANEVLNKFAFAFQRQYPDSAVCSINWGPWAGGMVTDTLKLILETSGVHILPIDTGVQYLLDELTMNSGTQVNEIVINGTDTMRPAQAEVKTQAKADMA